MATPEEQQITEQDESPPQEQEGGANEGNSTVPSDLIEWFNVAVQQYDATFVIYYRGLR